MNENLLTEKKAESAIATCDFVRTTESAVVVLDYNLRENKEVLPMGTKTFPSAARLICMEYYTGISGR